MGVLVMFRRGDGDGKRSWEVNCSQLGPGLVCWVRVWLLDAKRQNDRAECRRPWFSGSQCPAPAQPREDKQEGGGDWYRTDTAAFDSRPCRPSAEKEGPAFNPTIHPANPVRFWRLGRPTHQLHLTKTPPHNPVLRSSEHPHQGGVLSVKGGCHLISTSSFFPLHI
jgi:hypothetical protein